MKFHIYDSFAVTNFLFDYQFLGNLVIEMIKYVIITDIFPIFIKYNDLDHNHSSQSSYNFFISLKSFFNSFNSDIIYKNDIPNIIQYINNHIVVYTSIFYTPY